MITATELMIGDWVLYGNTPTKVNYLNENKIGTEDNYIASSEVTPIPLTEEILKANGWEKANNHYYIGELFKWSASVALFDDGSVITITNDLEYRGVNNIHICDNGYVHILQHALRICGLNELADNFKVK